MDFIDRLLDDIAATEFEPITLVKNGHTYIFKWRDPVELARSLAETVINKNNDFNRTDLNACAIRGRAIMENNYSDVHNDTRGQS